MSKVTGAASARHRVIPEIAPEMLRADLRKAENAECRRIGACLDEARHELKWTLDELAGRLPAPQGSEKRDPRQVQRWIDGTERCQVDVVFAVEALREPFVIALAKLAQMRVEETVTIRRTA